MKHIEVVIEGTTPLLCNRFGDAAGMDGPKSSIVGDKGSPREIATEKLYLSVDNQPMIPAPNLFRAIIDGGKFFKIGKSNVTTLKSSIVPAGVAIEEIELPIQTTEQWEVDTRAVRIPATGGRVLRHRPCFYKWKLSFTLVLDETVMTLKMLREILDAAGSKIGLGDFRPSCKGPYGKFNVVKWEQIR